MKKKEFAIKLTATLLIGVVSFFAFWMVYGGQELFKLLLSGLVFGTVIFTILQATRKSGKKYSFKFWRK